MAEKDCEDSSSKDEAVYLQVLEWKNIITYIRLDWRNQTTMLSNSHCQWYREMYA
jgi:hypothetical protein